MRIIFRFFLLAFCLCSAALAQPKASTDAPDVAILGVGDVVRITVYQNPDLTVDGARISESGQLNFPLIGNVNVSGLTITGAEQRIAKALRDGGFVLKPQVTIQVSQIRSSVISVLGQVGRPGRYPIDTVGAKVSEMIAVAGGVGAGGSDILTLSGTRNGRPVKLEIDLPSIIQSGQTELDVPVENGDIIFVDRAPIAYIYGEVGHPGTLSLTRGMSLLQAIAQAGGISQRGTERGMKVHRRDANGNVVISDIKMNDPVQRDDVIYVKESLF